MNTDSGRDASTDRDGAPPCPTDRTQCGGECVDLATDDRFCGDCAIHCGLGMCVQGTCAPAWVDVAAGPTHTCAQTSEGRIYCWGKRSFQAGSSAEDNTSIGPTRVMGFAAADPPSRQSDTLALGNEFSCALGSMGGTAQVRCWGSDASSVMGSSSGRALVVSGIAGPLQVSQLRAGHDFVCGIDTNASPHLQFCWGQAFSPGGCSPTMSNCAALLGPNSDAAIPGRPVQFLSAQPRPASLAGFDLGDEYGCISGDAADGSSAGTLCWGSADGKNHGQDTLSTGLDDLTRAFVPSARFQDLTLDQIEAGELFACGLIKDSQEVVCWGGEDVVATDGVDSSGTLLLPLYRRAPGENQMHIPSTVLRNAYDLSVGDWHACAAVETAGSLSVDCWGIVPAADPRSPNISFLVVAVPTPSQSDEVLLRGMSGVRVTDLAASRFHTCALFENHDLVCWGANPDGQLGVLPQSADMRGVFRDHVLCAPDEYEVGGACAF